jgi:hypothetical protein
MTQREARTWSPKWLEYSGLPELLAQKIKSGAGWPLFKKIVELDCEKNSAPGTVEISLEELQKRCGVAPETTRKAAIALRKLKLLACFIPDNDEEAALFRVVTPLQTPRTAEQIRLEDAHLFENGADYMRYYDDCMAGKQEDLPTNDPDLKEVVDLYFDTIGLKMNVFILDELRMLPQRFTMQEVRSVFRRARKNEIRSLHWVIQELVRRRKKAGEVEQPAQTPLFAGSEDDNTIKF